MADRRVTQTKKDRDGDITALCRPGETWSPRSKAGAIRDIEGGAHTYHVLWPDNVRTEIRVVDDRAKGKYLRTDKDGTTRNNLRDLPNC